MSTFAQRSVGAYRHALARTVDSGFTAGEMGPDTLPREKGNRHKSCLNEKALFMTSFLLSVGKAPGKRDWQKPG